MSIPYEDESTIFTTEMAYRIRQSIIDRRPCLVCGGDRLRTDFTGSGKCHVPLKPQPTEIARWKPQED